MSSWRPFCAIMAVAFLQTGATAVRAQESTASPSTQEKELELKKKEVELKQKEIDLAKQQAELDQLKEQLTYEETAQAISINLQGDVLFDFGKAAIRPEAEASLEKVAAVVGAFPEGKATIAGHTDSKGSPKENLALSRERAQAVKDWLVKKKGLPGATITTEGFGETVPIAENKNPDGSDNPVGRAQNRRVTITVEK